MENNLKALIVILSFSLPAWYLVKSVFLRFMSKENFELRRNAWITLTVVAFLSPSFWVYFLIATPLTYVLGRKDNNPLALYMVLIGVIPPIGIEIPALIVNKFFDLTNFRLLTFTILIPIWLNQKLKKDKKNNITLHAIDGAVVMYMFLQIVLLWPYEDVTNTIRRGFLFLIDVALIYYAFSRFCKTKAIIIEVMAAFVMSLAVVTPIAVYESRSAWLLYAGLAPVWGVPPDILQYVFRGDSLRAQLSAGHSLTLGYLCAIAFGFWLCISNFFSKRIIIIYSSIIWLGLLAALSRAPWLVAALIFFLNVFFQKNGIQIASKYIIIFLFFLAGISLLPIGEKIIDHLPFIGTIDGENIEYRKKFAEAALDRIIENPIFGDPFYMSHLEDLRQGQGIIDPVNTYAAIAMLYGIVGLIVYVAPMILALYGVLKTVLPRSAEVDDELQRVNIGIFACMSGTLIFLGTCSLIGSIPIIYYILVGLSVAAVAVSKK